MPDNDSTPSEVDSSARRVGRTGARFPSARQLDRLGAGEPEHGAVPGSTPERRRPGGTGARFPSAKMLERLERETPATPAPEPEPRPPAPEPETEPEPVPEPPEPMDVRSLVRPYVLTSGRTSSTTARGLALETLLTACGNTVPDTFSAEHRAAHRLCAGPCSVAEVAALLSLPLGVARVLLADLADAGLVTVHARGYTDLPGWELMERVLRGLRGL